MDQAWFEMRDLRRRHLDNAVWIPLRAAELEETGPFGYVGYRCEFFGLSSVAVPVERRDRAETLDWSDIGLQLSHHPYVEDGRYVPSDLFDGHGLGLGAVPLVLEQDGNADEPAQWHLHQDFGIALGLKREADLWVAIDEGYVEVARLHKRNDGKPSRLEVRADHLKDYLCARKMALYVCWYRDRQEVVIDASRITWSGEPLREESDRDRWEGAVTEIHEGGHPFGRAVAVLHLGRENVDYGEDVPRVQPSDPNIMYRADRVTLRSPRLFVVRGELWCNEWVNPGAHSPRVRRDETAPSASFFTDAAGTRENAETLRGSGRWLWFKPAVITELTRVRGGRLVWYTRDTGAVRCCPNYDVHFGVNKLGLVNAFAKDVVLLRDWQQRIWAAFSITPEGGVSEELHAAQAAGTPANTEAPEARLGEVLELLNKIGATKFGFPLFREHKDVNTLLAHTHRFRAVDQAGLFSLAKDVARLTADSLDTSALQRIVAPPKDQKWGSLKSLGHVLAKQTDAPKAHSLLGPLHGAYNLRHADAHLPQSDLAEAYGHAGIDPSAPFVVQGYQLLHSCVTALHEIARILQGGTEEDGGAHL